MPDNPNISCSYIKEKIKPFLDDLLSDDEFQDFVSHLDSCPQCTAYVSSLGAFSNQLWELRNVKVPADLTETILYKFKEAEKVAPASKVTMGQKKTAVVVTVLVCLGISLFIGSYFVKLNKAKEEEEKKKALLAESSSPKIEESSSYSYQPRPFSDNAPTIETRAIVEVREDSGRQESDTSRSIPARETGSALAESALHYHYGYTSQAQITKLLEALRELGIELDCQTSDILVFKASDEEIERMVSVIEMFATLRNYGGGTLSGENRVVIYLENKSFREAAVESEEEASQGAALVSLESAGGASSNTLHAHVASLTSKEDAVISVASGLGGSVEYKVPGFVLLKIAKEKIEKLIEQVQAIEGVFANFTGTNSLQGVPNYTPVKVSIYFSKK
ncbi:MAG: zf-HC2 domain-containing protein [Candidatus Omnitrophica bacterium]|nr:zf-HC2 domain-containing protein [Candidatus Omnitrophota bacterium]